MARTTITIVLELDESTDCLSGSARLLDGTVREFHGWLGLATTLDSLAGTPWGRRARLRRLAGRTQRRKRE